MVEEFLMCEPLVATTMSRNVKDKVDAFLAAILECHFGLFCIDGACYVGSPLRITLSL